MKKTILFCVLAMGAIGAPIVQVKAASQAVAVSLPYTEDEIVMMVLAQAAPEFRLSFAEICTAYENNQVTIEPDSSSPGTYLVTYGGLGILIVIDGS
jgi:hypothetical protein